MSSTRVPHVNTRVCALDVCSCTFTDTCTSHINTRVHLTRAYTPTALDTHRHVSTWTHTRVPTDTHTRHINTYVHPAAHTPVHRKTNSRAHTASLLYHHPTVRIT